MNYLNYSDYLIVLGSISIAVIFFIFFRKYLKLLASRNELNNSNSPIKNEIFKTSSFEIISLIIVVLILRIFELNQFWKTLIITLIVLYIISYIFRVFYRLNKFMK